MDRLTTKNETGVNVFKNGYECNNCSDTIWRLPDVIGNGSPTDKLAYYEDLEERLEKIYGECGELLKTIVDSLEKNHKLSNSVFKSRLLIEEDVDKWEQLKERDTSKKPYEITNLKDFNGNVYKITGRCPNCGVLINGTMRFCDKCGQHLSWSKRWKLVMDEKKIRESINFIKTLITVGNGDERLYTAIEALEKQLPKKPNEVKDVYTSKIGEFRVGKCPNCVNKVSDRFDLCLECRQKLDWLK